MVDHAGPGDSPSGSSWISPAVPLNGGSSDVRASYGRISEMTFADGGTAG